MDLQFCLEKWQRIKVLIKYFGCIKIKWERWEQAIYFFIGKMNKEKVILIIIDEILTPPANDLILHGVTRDSVIKIIKNMNRFKVTERMINIKEIIKGIKENRVYEIFTSGCAVTIGSV